MTDVFAVKVNINKPIKDALEKAVPSKNGDVHLSFHTNATERLIPKHMYSGLNNVTKVSIPASVKEIESHAFAGCQNLAHVHFEGDELPKIHPLAFTGCSLNKN